MDGIGILMTESVQSGPFCGVSRRNVLFITLVISDVRPVYVSGFLGYINCIQVGR